MDRAAYRLIWSCLHEDSRKLVSSEKLNKAFNIWTEVRAKVLDEEENTTPKFKDMVDIRRIAAVASVRRRRSDDGRTKRGCHRIPSLDC
jgi:hypothetical protein